MNTDSNDEVDSDTAAHEAGHVVMRWLCGLKPTSVWIDGKEGFCEGTGEVIPTEYALLVALAGYASQGGLLTGWFDFATCKAVDFDDARQQIAKLEFHRVQMVNDEHANEMTETASLELWFSRTCELLWPHSFLIDTIAEHLVSKHQLSASEVKTLIDDYRADICDSGV